MNKYKIYKIHIFAELNIRKVKLTLFTEKSKLNTLCDEKITIDEDYKTVVCTENEISIIMDDIKNNISKYFLGHAYNWSYYNLLSYYLYEEDPYGIISLKLSYKETDFNSENILYWKENLKAKDLMIMLNQEQININELLK